MSRNTKKIKNKKAHFKALLLLILIVLLLIIGGSFALWHHYHKKQLPNNAANVSSNTINYSPSTPKDNAANNSRKSSSTPAQTLVNGPTATSSVPPSITITRAGVIGSDLEVGTLVNGVTSGNCTLSVSQSGQQTVTRAEDVQQQNNAYSCPVFDVPVSAFPNQGNWDVSVTVTSNGQSQTGQWQGDPVSLSNN